VAESEAERLKEALGSLEDKTLVLQDTLLASESHSSGGAAQRRALERGKTEDRESLQVLIRSLVGCEEEHRSRAKRLDLELRLTKERLALLQDSGSRTESRYAQETARLQHQLLKAANKGTAAQKELRAHGGFLSKLEELCAYLFKPVHCLSSLFLFLSERSGRAKHQVAEGASKSKQRAGGGCSG
jgi:septal ring factor EnvC (AmiA/AmiB activator)